MERKWNYLFIFLSILVIIGFTIKSIWNKQSEINNSRADKLLEVADSLVCLWDLEQCMKYVDESERLYSKDQKYRAELFKKELQIIQAEDFVRELFETIDKNSYMLLEKGEYKTEYFKTPSIKKAIDKKLYDNRALWADIIADKLEREKKAQIEAAKKRAEVLIKEKEEEKAKEDARKEVRKLYEKILRNNFLDAGLDIKVAVRGKYSERLELTFVLFNDVWLRKLETEGLLRTWHEMGFNRIDLMDGYDYHKYYHWD